MLAAFSRNCDTNACDLVLFLNYFVTCCGTFKVKTKGAHMCFPFPLGLGRGDNYQDNSLDVFQYFTSSCYNQFNDEEKVINL